MATLAELNAAKINGSDYVLMVNMGTDVAPDYKVLLCQTNVSIDRQRASKDSSTKCGSDEYLEDEKSSCKMDGQMIYGSFTGVVTTKGVHDIFGENTPRGYKLAPNVGKGKIGMPVYSWNGYLTNLADDFGMNDKGKQSLTANSIGKITVTELTVAG